MRQRSDPSASLGMTYQQLAHQTPNRCYHLPCFRAARVSCTQAIIESARTGLRNVNMFEASNRREASITLCLFPHLAEFIAVDTRSSLPDGAAVHIMAFEDVFTEEFQASVEAGFSALLRKEGVGLIEMIGLPQEVETLVRAESMKRIIKRLNHAANIQSTDLDGGIGVLFFARGLLSIEKDQLEAAVDDLFGHMLTDSQMSRLQNELERLIDEERAEDDKIKERELAQLITGEPGSFVTLWQNGGDRQP